MSKLKTRVSVTYEAWARLNQYSLAKSVEGTTGYTPCDRKYSKRSVRTRSRLKNRSKNGTMKIRWTARKWTFSASTGLTALSSGMVLASYSRALPTTRDPAKPRIK